MMFESLFLPVSVFLLECVIAIHAKIEMNIPNGPSMPLAKGSQVNIVCTGSNITQSNVGLRLLHDDVQLCSGCENIPINNLTLTENIRVTFVNLSPDVFFFLIAFDNLTEEDNGRYTCQTSPENSASIDVLVAGLACESSRTHDRLDFTVGEDLELTCYNPFPYSVGWFSGGKMLPSRATNISSDFELTTTKITLGLESDSESFECTVTKNADTETSPKPCIIGPIRVSPFIEITSSVGDEIDVATDTVTFNCRVFPENNETLYQWTVDSWVDYSEVVDWVADSTLTVYNLSLTAGEVIKVTCEGFFRNSTFTTDYAITVVKPVADVVMIIIIASSAVALLIAVVIMIGVCRCIVRRFQRKTLTFAEVKYPASGDKELKTEHSSIVLNKYEKGPTEFAGIYLTGNDLVAGNDKPTILTQLPDGRLQLQERKMSIDNVNSHGSTCSDVSNRSIETSMIHDIYDESPTREDVDTSSLQEIYDEPPNRESLHSENVPRPLSILLPREHNTPSFRVAASERPLFIGKLRPISDGAGQRAISLGSLPPIAAIEQDTEDENVYHDSLVDDSQYYEEEPIYRSVKNHRSLQETDEFYNECDEEEDDYAAITMS